MEDFVQDLRFALRVVARHPGSALAAVVILALGIGANTAVFSVAYSVLLRPLPFRDAGSLVRVGDNPPTAPARYLDWRARNEVFSDMAAIVDTEYSGRPAFLLTGNSFPERLNGALVSANFFDLLGTLPAQGRTFRAGEDQAGNEQVVVLSDGLWRRQFGADPGIVGTTVRLSGRPYIVVGVMPPDFQFSFPRATDAWVPLVISDSDRTARNRVSYKVVARLKPGVTVAQARLSMGNLSAALGREYPETDARLVAAVVPVRDQIFGPVRRPLLVLELAAGFVLLLTCTNVSNLMLARLSSRGREIGVRAALGAGRGRLLRQFLTEGVLLAAVGGILGVFLAVWSRPLLAALVPANFPRGNALRIDGWVLGFSALTAGSAGVLFSLLPAWWASRSGLVNLIKTGSIAAAASGQPRRMRSILVVGQAALAFALLAGAGLLLKSLWRLDRVDLGFDPDKLLVTAVSLPAASDGGQSTVETVGSMLRQIELIPGVKRAAASAGFPTDTRSSGLLVRIPGHLTSDGKPNWSVLADRVTPEFFPAIGLRLIKGRLLGPDDRIGSEPVVVINEALALRAFPDEDPIGQHVLLTFSPDAVPAAIVGVVSNSRFFPRDAMGPAVYQPFAQASSGLARITIRTAVDPSAVAPAVRKAIWSVEPNVPITALAPYGATLGRSISDTHFFAVLLGLFAACALVLSALGLYGVMSCAVGERTREIGIRLALGAPPGTILGDVVGRALRLTLAGLAGGAILALASTRALRALLFGLTPADPSIFVAGAILLLLVALAAAWLPARRAAKVDPMTALRME